MAVNATELVGKLNFVISSRRFKEKGYIEDYPALPRTSAEEEDIVSEMMFAFVKKLFPGCKVRANANSYSLRLDGQVHRKANKLREIYNNDTEWRNWFESNHNNLHRTMRDNRQSFNNSSFVERRMVEDKIFLYVPKAPNRIQGYVNHGLIELCKWLEQEYKKDERLSNIYIQVTTMIEDEVKRREDERRERIARELNQYKEQILKELFKPVAPMQESQKAIERLFASKFSAWARENGKAPEYAIEAGPQQMVTRGLRVKIMAPPGAEEEGWVALPPFEGYGELEGYEMQGWGKVTNIDMTSDRSRRGQSPVVVQEYLYTEFNLEHWAHLLPENHAEILEVSQRLWAEAEVEIEPWLEQERIRKAKEEEERRQAEAIRQRELEEARRIAEEEIRQQVERDRARREAEQARAAELAERLREQAARELEASVQEAAQTPVDDAFARFFEPERREMPDIDVDAAPQVAPNADLLAALRGQFNAEPERATGEGLYRNSRAIPLERYVGITASGQTRRFASQQRAVEWLGYTNRQEVHINDYHVPNNLAEIYINEEYTPF